MTDPTEELVRRVVGNLLRSDYRGNVFCSTCLVKLARESLDTIYPKSEIERTMDTVFQSPGALRFVPALPRGAESVTPPHPSAGGVTTRPSWL
jgi:ferredoxin